MQLTKKSKIIISIIIIVILFGSYIFLDKRSKKQPITNPNTSVSTTTASSQKSQEIGNTGISVNGEGDFKIVQLPDAPKPIPNLDRQVVFGTQEATYSAEIKNTITQNITKLQTELKENPATYSDWINLGRYQKMAGDYNATAESWQYAGKLSPTSYVPFGNLGNLYGYFIKNNVKAESYYKQAISKGSTQAYLYTQFAEFYRDVVKDPSKALTVVDTGLSKIPNDPNLLQLQSSLEK